MAAIAPLALNAGLPVAQYAGLAGLPFAGHAGLPFHAGLNYGAPAFYNQALPATAPLVAAAPVQYRAAPVALQAAAPLVAAAPIAPRQYAVPAARLVEHAPAVETIHEKVEQHGYKIKY